MILFHGTTEIIEEPNVSFSKSYLDFGKGFYLTTYQKQAEKWALRKALRMKNGWTLYVRVEKGIVFIRTMIS